MLPRLVTPLLEARFRSNPAVALVGPRQSGKTTLARALGRVYFDLEQAPERLRLDLEWESVVGKRELVILDEAQS
ncbi:MAG: AAA family ATPase, partial [Vicinamibacteria bacterium]